MEEDTTEGSRHKKLKEMGKLMSDKQGYAAGMEVALGRAWCPMSGMEVKEMGANKFLFIFQQEAEKRKAVENGSWMFGKELLVMEEFDPAKSVDDCKFEKAPIWIRIFNVPLVMMCKELAEDIGEQIGHLVKVDIGEDGITLGQSLRVKVRIRVAEPLMRGLFLDDEEDKDGDAIVRDKENKKEEEEKH